MMTSNQILFHSFPNRNLNALVSLLIAFLLYLPVFSQQYYRIQADFSIKENTADGKQSLTLGTVYYDMNTQQITYEIKFPEKRTILLKDSLVYTLKNETIVSVIHSPFTPGVSIFHLALTAELENYGLENSLFKLDKTEREGNLVITSWLPGQTAALFFGKIMMAKEQKHLHSIIFFDSKEELISKQFFGSYFNFNGLEFPGEVIQINYNPSGEDYQMTKYKNVIVNNTKDDYWYNLHPED